MRAPFALLDAPWAGGLLFESLERTLVLESSAQLVAVCAEIERLTAEGRHVVAAIDYELGYGLEPSAGEVPGRPLGRFWVFASRRLLDAAGVEALLSSLDDGLPAAALEDFRPALGEEAHAAAVNRVREYIAAGDCYQVNFTFPFRGRCVGDPLALYRQLRRVQPVAHGAYIHSAEGAILCLSPELFIERDGHGVLKSRPMKGTAPRHEDAYADAASRNALASSEKDRAENIMIVDLIRNDMGRIADPGSVHVEAMCAIEEYPSVFQMTSTVRAVCHAPLSQVLAAMFPCGSITGAPKVRAMQIIRELEGELRGLYTGALGWIGGGGEFHLAVAIRTLTVEADGVARYGVGSGIVWDSVPSAEYAECLLKARYIEEADAGFRLIETMRLEAGSIPLLELHLARLAMSARRLAFVCNEQEVRARLASVAASCERSCRRVRLTLGRRGDIEIMVEAIEVSSSTMLAVFSPVVLASTDPWLRYKTTFRATYDAELKRVVAMPGVFDAVFLNERGEVCEGARSNIFLRRRAGEKLLTPPLSCGLLPGVLRRSLLERGEAEETVLRRQDLLGAAEIYLGNALRGLIPVKLITT